MVIAPNSVSSPTMNGESASTTAQDHGPVNSFCEAQMNDCRTGCFVMRKIIAHVFGRNKACTCQIPDHCWVQWCRKHYQRLRHRMLEQGWIFLQINCLRIQLGRMEKWGEVKSFTIVLQRRFQELNRKDPANDPEHGAGLIHLPDTTTISKYHHANEHTKACPNRFLYAFLGAEKSFDDVYSVIDAVEKAADEDQLKILPPLQFLPFIDATMHPPPLIARPRKQRKVYKKQAQNSMPNGDRDLKFLVGSNTAKSIDFSPNWHSSPALKSSLSHNTIKHQVAAELSSRQFSTTKAPITKISEHEIKYIIISNDEDAAAQRIVPDSICFKVFSDITSPVAQPSSSLSDIKSQVEVRTHPLLSSSTIEYEIDEASVNNMQDFTVDKDKDLAALSAESIVEKKQSHVVSNTLQLPRILTSQNGDSATKKRAGITSLLSSRVKRVEDSRKISILAPLPPKIQVLPAGSIPVIDNKHGFVGYKIKTAKSDKAGPLSAQRPHFHSRISRKNATTLEPTEPLSRNNPIQIYSYPIDPTRTYQSVLSNAHGHIEALAEEKCKDSAIETHTKGSFSLIKHTAANEHEDTDTQVLYGGNPILSIPQMGFYGWRPINVSTVTTPYPVSVSSTVNANDNTHSQEALTRNSDIRTKSAIPERFALAPSSSKDRDANTDPSPLGISARFITRRVLEPSSRILPHYGGEKRGLPAEVGSR